MSAATVERRLPPVTVDCRSCKCQFLSRARHLMPVHCPRCGHSVRVQRPAAAGTFPEPGPEEVDYGETYLLVAGQLMVAEWTRDGRLVPAGSTGPAPAAATPAAAQPSAAAGGENRREIAARRAADQARRKLAAQGVLLDDQRPRGFCQVTGCRDNGSGLRAWYRWDLCTRHWREATGHPGGSMTLPGPVIDASGSYAQPA